MAMRVSGFFFTEKEEVKGMRSGDSRRVIYVHMKSSSPLTTVLERRAVSRGVKSQ